MGQLPNDDIPRNRYAAGYRFRPKTDEKVVKVETTEKMVVVGNVIVFKGEQFEKPVSGFSN